jgi:hypothetical protein
MTRISATCSTALGANVAHRRGMAVATTPDVNIEFIC